MLFHRDDWTLFRNLNTIGQKAGVPREKLAALVIKELADNALDAGATVDAGDLGDDTFYVEDNGPGIPGSDEEIAMLFSIRRPLLSSKLLRLPLRGALGNGLRVVAGVVLATAGTLQVTTRGRHLALTPQDDGTTSYRLLKGGLLHTGTRVQIRFGRGVVGADEDVLEMAHKAMALRGETHYQGKTSPHWYDSDSFFEMLQASDGTIGEVLEHFHGFKSSKIPSSVKEALGFSANSFTRTSADNVLSGLREIKPAPKPTVLGEVGELALRSHGYGKKSGTFQLKAARGNLHAEIPAVVEAWVDRLDKDEQPQFEVYINRTPVTAETNAWRGSGEHSAKIALDGCGLNHYVKTGRNPLRIRLCVTAPYMPITTDGKEPDLKPLFNTITEAVQAAARKAKKVFVKDGISETASLKDVILENIEEAIEEASGGRRFSLRQLFYAIRPFVLDALGVEPNYNYFSTVITGYEQSIGMDVPKMYRDARGSLYHPHTGETITLGTLNIEKYERPKWRFNKVLYIEKGGFLPLLIESQWPERHDCAILTSQGFATRAARDAIDLIGETAEEILFFCIHDADGAGTGIHEALTEATKARPARRVKVVNLGLDPWEAVEMGLPTEKVERKRGKVPVAQYVKDRSMRWERWLQEQRVELNSMSSPAFLKWLDGKMGEYDSLGKVVPPATTLSEKFEEDARKMVRDKITERLLAEAGIDNLVDKACLELKVPAGKKLFTDVRKGLEEEPEKPWEAPFGEIVKDAVEKLAGL